jgi:hypothetical protein
MPQLVCCTARAQQHDASKTWPELDPSCRPPLDGQLEGMGVFEMLYKWYHEYDFVMVVTS